jgi:hypothetical protein
MKFVALPLAAISVLFALLLPPAKAQTPSANPMQHQVTAAERSGLEALKTGDLTKFAALTADEAILVDSHGAATKAQLLKNVAGFTLTDYSMDNVQFLKLSRDTGLISYTITEKGVSHGKEFSARAYVSSVWTKRGKGWQCLFSQETVPPRQ